MSERYLGADVTQLSSDRRAHHEFKSVTYSDLYQSVFAIGRDLQIIHCEGNLFEHRTSEGLLYSGQGQRWMFFKFCFRSPFTMIPKLLLDVTTVDADIEQNVQYNLSLQDVTRDGFTLRFQTWGTSAIASADIVWVAMSQQV